MLAPVTLIYGYKTDNSSDRQIQKHSWRDKIRGADSESLWKDYKWKQHITYKEYELANKNFSTLLECAKIPFHASVLLRPNGVRVSNLQRMGKSLWTEDWSLRTASAYTAHGGPEPQTYKTFCP
jgi:hypothetical protein